MVRDSHYFAKRLAVLVTLLPGLALAQPASPRSLPFEPLTRPGEIRPDVPAPAPPEKPGFVLPSLPVPGEGERLSGGPLIVVHEFRVTGSSVFREAELAAVTAPYLGHPIGSEKLNE